MLHPAPGAAMSRLTYPCFHIPKDGHLGGFFLGFWSSCFFSSGSGSDWIVRRDSTHLVICCVSPLRAPFALFANLTMASVICAIASAMSLIVCFRCSASSVRSVPSRVRCRAVSALRLELRRQRFVGRFEQGDQGGFEFGHLSFLYPKKLACWCPVHCDFHVIWS